MKRYLIWGLIALLFATPSFAADTKVSALPDGTVAPTWVVVCEAGSTPTLSKCTVSSLLALKIGTVTNGKVCLGDGSGVIQCTTNAYQTTTGSPAGFVIASQAQGDILYASSATAWARLGAGTAGNPLISGGAAANPSWLSVVLAGGTNTFSVTNGTASLDVAAGATLNIDKSLQVATGAVVINGNAGGSSVLTLPNQTVVLGTMTNAKLCGYTAASTSIDCDKDATGGTPTVITVADEAADTTSFPLFATAATGDLGPKTNAALTFNAATGAFGATTVKAGTASFAGGTNTFSITNGTASLDVAAGAVLNIDSSLQVTTGAVVLTGPFTMAAPGTSGNVLVSDGTNWTSSSTLSVSSITSGGIVLGDTTPDADGEIGYASNAYLWYANSEDWKITATTNLWTFDSNTSATFAFTPAVAFNGAITANGAVTLGDGGDDVRIKLQKNTSDGTWNGITLNLTCHETIAFGQLIFINSDGEAALADADAAATMPAVAIAVVGGSASDTCTFLTHGVISETDWNWTAGQTLYVSETAGGIENTVGNISDANDVVQVIGVALGADTILFNPSLTTVVVK